MKSTEVLQPDLVLRELAPIAHLIYRALEEGSAYSSRYFEQHNNDTDPYVASNLVRYHAGLYLEAHLEDVPGLVREPLANNGLFLKFHEYEIRVRKSDEGALPDPGQSASMMRFYQQPLENWNAAYSEVSLPKIKLVVIWDVDHEYELVGMKLVCPKSGSIRRGESTSHWQIEIPHPASDTSFASQWLSEQIEDEFEEDDLPLSANDNAQPRTDEKDV